MSIIHDALKKVQQTKPATPSTKSLPPVPAQPPAKQDDKVNIPLFVAALCAIVAMIFAALPYIALKMNPPPEQPAPAATPIATPTPQKPPPPPPPLPTSKIMTNAILRAITIPILSTPAVTIPKTRPLDKTTNSDDSFKDIQVEGVLDMGGKKAVLINGNIYEEGQTIYGKAISEITFNSLTIVDNGKKRTISVTP